VDALKAQGRWQEGAMTHPAGSKSIEE